MKLVGLFVIVSGDAKFRNYFLQICGKSSVRSSSVGNEKKNILLHIPITANFFSHVLGEEKIKPCFFTLPCLLCI